MSIFFKTNSSAEDILYSCAGRKYPGCRTYHKRCFAVYRSGVRSFPLYEMDRKLFTIRIFGNLFYADAASGFNGDGASLSSGCESAISEFHCGQRQKKRVFYMALSIKFHHWRSDVYSADPSQYLSVFYVAA